MDDLKFLLLFGFIPLAFLAWYSDFDFGTSGYDRDAHMPTVTFVPEGTPGAISLEEYNYRRYGWEPR